MEYCPYCSAPLSREFKTCPECKKSLSLDILQSLYNSGETSEIDPKVKRKIWYREHSHILLPMITLVIGIVVGALATYSGAMLQFANERSGYQNEISNLQNQINNSASATADLKGSLESQINKKDSIIKILEEQQSLMSRIITFTRRLAGNSTITVNSEEEGAFFNRNVRYLIRLYNEQTGLLQATGYEPIPEYNLETVPQFLAE